MKKNKNNKSIFINNSFIIFTSIIIINILLNPTLSIKSAKEGANIWFNILLPSLLPFFILSNLVIELGLMDVLGKLLNPIISPVLNISGQGIFPLIMSVMSGYPVGAKLTSKLRETNSISKLEGDRLIAFASTSGPLFIIGSVLIGMLNSPDLSFLMLMPHYLGTFTLAIIFRFYKKDRKEIRNESLNLSDRKTKSIGISISNSVKDSMESIINIGGFVILYLVLINILLSLNIVDSTIINISQYLNLNPDLLEGLFAGIIEITVGCQKVSTLNIKLIEKIIIINFIIGWAGFSIHSQALSFINKTDINVKIYLFSKFLHGVFSSIYTYIIYIIKYRNTRLFPVFNEIQVFKAIKTYSFLGILSYSIKTSIICIFFFIILSILLDQLSRRR